MSDARGELAKLPSMTELLDQAASMDGLRDAARPALSDAVRRSLEYFRGEIRGGRIAGEACTVLRVLERAREFLATELDSLRLRGVINATGVVLHTGLGRSPLADAAIERLVAASRGYCNLEISLESGARGQRGEYCERLLCRLTGAEAALVVNNNAAATMLVLHGLARGREVIVSRGQLIEIGGSFRLPEVMTAGGATLREVGTTNKTHLSDYERAIGETAAMIMHVHTSNYRVVGFSECPPASELVALAHSRGLPLFDDLGSGALMRDDVWSAAGEPTVVESLRNGADVVAFSGDKLLGGPQAGILLGKQGVIERLRKDPMARALRIGRMTIAALEATLELYQDSARAIREIPLLAALAEAPVSIEARARTLATRLRAAAAADQEFVVEADESFAGGGSLPAWPMPTYVVAWRPAGCGSIDGLTRRLRTGTPSVLPRVREGRIYFDLRTIREGEYDEVAAAVASAMRESRAEGGSHCQAIP